jgi:hypothetical protein
VKPFIRRTLTVLRRPWVMAIMGGTILTLVSFAYVSSPAKSSYDPHRPIIYAPGPKIQVTHTDLHQDFDRCNPEMLDDHRGLPMSMIRRFGAESCTGNRFLYVFGIIFNVLFYTFLVRGGIVLWQKYGHKLRP